MTLTKNNKKNTKNENTKNGIVKNEISKNEITKNGIDKIDTNQDIIKLLRNKKILLLKNYKSKLQEIFSKIPQNILKLPILNIKDALNTFYDGEEIKLVDINKKTKRESTVSLTFGEEYTYDGRTFLDSKGKVKNESLDQNLKDLLKNAKKIADRMGKDMSLFIE